MSVYVDDANIGYGRMRMSHMIADSDEELHALAAKLGLLRAWHQAPPAVSTSHYDVSKSRRKAAEIHGAIIVTMRELAAMSARRRATGSLGKPEEAIEWYKQSLAPSAENQ